MLLDTATMDGVRQSISARKPSCPGAQPLCRLTASIEVPGVVIAFSRNEEIYGEDESADFVYKVVSGTVRISKILSDGRRQISGFCVPGDVFGFESGKTHRFSAEAVADCEIMMVRRSVVENAASSSIPAARELWALAQGELERARDHMLLLGRKNAQERVAAFLLEMAARGGTRSNVELPMSRLDIADYLGLTIETVSRTLAQLERDHTIALPSSRKVVFCNRALLAGADA